MLPVEPNQPVFTPVETPGGLVQNPETAPITYSGSGTRTGSPAILRAGPSVGALLHSLKRRWLSAGLLAGILACCVAAVIWRVAPAPYEATAYVHYQGNFPVYETGKGGGYIEMKDRMRSQANYLRIQVTGQVLKSEEVKSFRTYQELGGLDAWAEDHVTITAKEGEMTIPIVVEGEHPQEIKLIADRIAQGFITQMEQKRADYKENLERSLANLDAQLHEAYESRQKVFKGDLAQQQGSHLNQRELLKSQLTQNREQQTKLSAELVGYQSEETALKQKLDQISEKDVASVTAPRRDVLEEQLRDPRIKSLDKQIEQKSQEYSQEESLTPKRERPYSSRLLLLKNELTRLQDQRKGIAQQIESQVQDDARKKQLAELKQTSQEELAKTQRTIRRLEAMKQSLAQQEPDLQKQLGALDPDVALPPSASVLALKIKTLGEELRKRSEQLAELEAEEPQKKGNAQQAGKAKETTPSLPWVSVSLAQVPESRERKKQMMFTALGFLGTFGVVLLGVAFFDFRKRYVTNAEQVTEGLGIPTLGSLPRLPNSARYVEAAEGDSRAAFWQSRLMESVDALRTFLLRNLGEGPRVVMISSAVEGEGKTTLASQLAASCARSWRKTLLIDGDLRKPAAHELFQLPKEPGFSEVLRGEMDLEDVIRPTSLGRLSMMPAGHWDAHALQALAQEGAQGFLEQLKDEYEVIIVDSAPILPVTDSLLLGQHVDTVILTGLCDKSRLPGLYAANQRLLAVGIPVLGSVLIGGSGDATDVGLQYPRYTAAVARDRVTPG